MTGYGDSTDGAQAATAIDAAGATPLADTAFRKAEKRYQLHYEQQMRQRKGRMRLGKLVEQPTDLSDVVDIRQPAATPDVATVVLRQPEQCPSVCSCNGTVTALVFKRHPGLVVFPAAVPAEVQLQLMHAALDQWPDPPARTNHTKAYSTCLCRLFQAATQGLTLVPTEHQQQLQGQQQLPQQQPEGQQQVVQLDLPGSHHHHPQLQQPNTCQACQHDQTPPPLSISQGQHLQQQHRQESTHHCQQQQQQQFPEQLPHHPDSSSSSSPWLPNGTGPKAASLLRKLRWVCLGPPYNWTDRLYEPHLPHRPLPPSLVQLAQQHAQLAHQAMLLAEFSIAGCGATPARTAQQGSLPSAAAADAAAARSSTVPSAAGGSYHIDAALPAPAAADGAAAASSSAGPSAASSCLPDAAVLPATPAAAGGAAAAGSMAGPLAVSSRSYVPGAALPPAPTAAAGGAAEPAAVSSRSYVPDAALVNYYHSGDTLNGHKDDVERDLDQPIVTVSLGCDAVFLVGGATRDVEPTALLLRSGDVIVMGQEARACYHGVPRVLTDRPLPPELLQAAEQASPAQQQCLQHMQGCRINISIRTTA